MNQTTDGFLTSLLNDDDLQIMDMAMSDCKYPMFVSYHNLIVQKNWLIFSENFIFYIVSLYLKIPYW